MLDETSAAATTEDAVVENSDLNEQAVFDPEDPDLEAFFKEWETAEADTAPTPEQDDAENADGSEEAESPTTETEVTEQPHKIEFRAKIDREDVDVSLDETELPSIYQKSQNYDRLQSKYDKQSAQMKDIEAMAAELGYDSVEAMVTASRESNRNARMQELIDDGTNERVARMVVDRELADASAAWASKATAEEDSADTETQDDYRAQVDELFAARPELRGTLKQLPEEVSQAVVAGTPLRVAYAEWEARQAIAEKNRYAQERNSMRQQNETAGRSPVRSVGDNGVSPQREDPFLKGWDLARQENDW